MAASVSLVWGFGFVVIKFGLESFSAAQLTAVRFLVACLPVLVVPRPRISWLSIVLIGMTLFTGQFLLLFFAFTKGMPAGLASVSQQMQSFFTVLLAALFLRDLPSRRQCVGMSIGFGGLAVIGSTVGSDLKLIGLCLALAAAFSWAVGNVLVKRTVNVPALSLIAWCSLIPPVPALVMSSLYDPHPDLWSAVTRASWLSLGSVVYLGAIASLWAYTIWGSLLQRYSTAVIVPFALLAPCAGVLSSAILLGETFSLTRFAGMALILAGLAVSVLPVNRASLSDPHQPINQD